MATTTSAPGRARADDAGRGATSVHMYYPASGDETVRHLIAAANARLDLHLHPHGGGFIAEGLTARPLRHRIETYGYRLLQQARERATGVAVKAASDLDRFQFQPRRALKATKQIEHLKGESQATASPRSTPQ